MPEMTTEEKLAKAEAKIEEKIREGVDSGTLELREGMAKLQTELEEAKATIERNAALSRVSDVPGMAEEARGKFSFSRVARSLVARYKQDPKWREYAGFEWECDEQVRANDPSLSPDEFGGFIVAPQIQNERLIEPFLDYIVPQSLGATVLTGLSGSPVLVPKIVTEAEAESLVEHEAATDTEVELGQIRMEPRTAQAVINPSRQFLTLGQGADALLESQIGKAVAKKISRMAFSGTGSSGEPIGVKNAPGINSVNFTAAPNAVASPYAFEHELYYKLLQMEGALEDIDALQDAGSIGWAMHAKAKRAILGMKSENASAGTDSLDVGRAPVGGRAVDQILGYQFRTTGTGLTGGATTDLILGDWSQMVVGYWGGLMMEATTSTERAVRRREVMISVYQDYDIGFFHPEAFCVAKNFNTTNV